MPEPAMHEHIRRDRPPRPPEVMHLEPEGLLHVLRTHYRELQEVDRDVDRDQPLHGGRDSGSLGVFGDLVGHAGPATAIYGSTRYHNYTARRNRLFLNVWAIPLRPTRFPRCCRTGDPLTLLAQRRWPRDSHGQAGVAVNRDSLLDQRRPPSVER